MEATRFKLLEYADMLRTEASSNDQHDLLDAVEGSHLLHNLFHMHFLEFVRSWNGFEELELVEDDTLDYLYPDDVCDEEQEMEENLPRDFYKYSLEQMQKIVEMADDGSPFTSIQHNYRKLKDTREISRYIVCCTKCYVSISECANMSRQAERNS